MILGAFYHGCERMAMDGQVEEVDIRFFRRYS